MAVNQEAQITVKLMAKDLASGQLGAFASKLDTVAKRGGIAGNVVQGMGIQLGMMLNPIMLVGRGVQMLGDALHGAMAEEQNISKMTTALGANIEGWDGVTDSIEANIKSREGLAFADDEQRDALSQLVTRTHNVKEAEDLLRQSMDLARLKSMKLGDAALLLGKVYSGQTQAARRAGIAIDKNATSTEALAQIQQASAGQAEAYADTMGGSIEAVQIQLADLSEDAGGVLVAGIQILGAAFETFHRTLDGGYDLQVRTADAIREAGTAAGMTADEIDRLIVQSQMGQTALQQAAESGTAFFGLNVQQMITYNEEYSRAEADAIRAQMEATGATEAEIQKRLAVTEWGIRENAAAMVRAHQYDLQEQRRHAQQSHQVALSSAHMTFDPYVHIANEAFQTVSELVRYELGPGMRDNIQSGKGQARGAIQDYMFALKHPFAEENYGHWLKRKIEKAQTDLVTALDHGNDNAATEIRGFIRWAQAEYDSLDANIGVSFRYNRSGPVVGGGGGRQWGGPVGPGVYTVGERGPETLVMSPNGGYVIPSPGASGPGKSGGGMTVNVQFHSVAPPTASEGQAIARMLVPELTREMRRQGAL